MRSTFSKIINYRNLTIFSLSREFKNGISIQLHTNVCNTCELCANIRHKNDVSTLSKVNLFILGMTVSSDSGHPAAEAIGTATGALLSGFQNGVPFTQILAFFHDKGIECTIDDLLAWSHIFSKVTLHRPLNLNNDTGIYTLSEASPYNNEPDLAELHFHGTGQTYDAVPPDGDSTLGTSSSTSSEAFNEALGEVLLPLFGFLFTLLGMFVINVVIENMKTYYGIRTGEDEEEDKEDDDKKDDKEDDDKKDDEEDDD
jgi:hypothetical protein